MPGKGTDSNLNSTNNVTGLVVVRQPEGLDCPPKHDEPPRAKLLLAELR